jgi:hypothetical protein
MNTGLYFHVLNLIIIFCQTSVKSIDHIELLREQQKILSGEVALHSSALKRLSEEAARNPQKDQIHVFLVTLSSVSSTAGIVFKK